MQPWPMPSIFTCCPGVNKPLSNLLQTVKFITYVYAVAGWFFKRSFSTGRNVVTCSSVASASQILKMQWLNNMIAFVKIRQWYVQESMNYAPIVCIAYIAGNDSFEIESWRILFLFCLVLAEPIAYTIERIKRPLITTTLKIQLLCSCSVSDSTCNL